MAQDPIRDNQFNRKATADALRRFLDEMIRASGLELKATVHFLAQDASAEEGEAEVAADVDGKDREILLEHSAEVLKAIEHLALRALRLEPAFHEKIHIDCGGYRAVRFEEFSRSVSIPCRRASAASFIWR
jgi:predicted RNA-binding protein Jag